MITPPKPHDSVADLPVCVAALYQFALFEDCQALRLELLATCRAHAIKGTLILAREGINGTIAGSDTGIAAVMAHIRSLPGCAEIEVKFSRAASMPFHRLKIRLKQEIVTMGQPDIDPRLKVGRYIRPQDWNNLISDPETILIDTRNDYEVEIGTFKGAINPQTGNFREFPAWFRAARGRLLEQGKTPKVAMFCTGGIRCEKSTSFLIAEGVEEVYHLQGGILKYLEMIPQEQSLWEGECFVFDQRVSVGHGLALGHYGLCHACRRPVSAADQQSPLFEAGVSCPACHDERSEAQRASYRERQRQEQLASQRGQAHIGAELQD